ncbi:hypothetical protein ACIGO9_03970 [Nocardia asteroides]|uniref:hypothetical protein n=1 Tax=Nocardia asteroides TaxID=1824 RepID=UPI0037CAE6E5
MESTEADRGQREFWRAATLAVAGGVALGVTVFGGLAAVADRQPSGWDPSASTVVWIVVAVLGGIAAVCVAVRRTPRMLGVATGVAAAALVIGLGGLVLR